MVLSGYEQSPALCHIDLLHTDWLQTLQRTTSRCSEYMRSNGAVQRKQPAVRRMQTFRLVCVCSIQFVM